MAISTSVKTVISTEMMVEFGKNARMALGKILINRVLDPPPPRKDPPKNQVLDRLPLHKDLRLDPQLDPPLGRLPLHKDQQHALLPLLNIRSVKVKSNNTTLVKDPRFITPYKNHHARVVVPTLVQAPTTAPVAGAAVVVEAPAVVDSY